MPAEPHLRVSDQEREEAAAAIREHYAAGRLDSAEFEERVQAAYGARTQSELSALSADLPALPPKPPTTIERARQTFNTSVLVRNASAGGVAFLACTGLWAATGASGDFWPRWVLIFTVVTIVRGVRRGARGPGPYGGGRGQGRGPYYSYRYEYRYGDGDERHEHHHEHRS
ncbi:MAG: DUF1707 domain-containing protein [Acidobacteriota bacterium]|nr:DUF1707 domain-containing protein [Acidobacteriota bacterium]